MRRSAIGLIVALGLGGAAACEPAADSQQAPEPGPEEPVTANQLTAEEQAEGWVLLFDGRTLDGWTNRGVAEWRVQDGSVVSIAGTGEGHLATNRSFGDFRLRIDFWVDETANSGIYFRVPESEPATISNSFEVQIFDAGPVWQTGAVIEIQPVAEKPRTAGRWNTFDITADGNQLVVLRNGEKVVDAVAEPRLPSGPIILAPVDSGEVRFRNIRLLPL
jgi:hypothetical protein